MEETVDTLVSEGFSASLFGLNKEHWLVFKTARSQTDLPAALRPHIEFAGA